MGNELNEHEDQAAELRKLFNEVQGEEQSFTNVRQEGWGDSQPFQDKEIDILNLPPRKEIHSKQNKRTHIRFSRPFIRLMVVILIILGILMGLYFVWGEN